MRTSRLRALSFAFALFASASPAAARPQAPGIEQASPPNPAEVFRDVLTRFYRAYEKKDLAAAEQVWHPQGPARYARNLLEVEFERRSATLAGIVVRQASVDPGGGRARALVDLDVTDAKTGRTRRERRVREFTFLEDGGAWKIWNESASGAGSVGSQLAERLLGAAPPEAAALIAADPEIRSDDTLTGLGLEVNRLRTRFNLGEVLKVLHLQAQLAKAIDNEPVLARSLLDTGLTLQVAGRQQEAREAFMEARPIFAAVGTRTEVATIDANLGAAHYLLGEYEKAAERYRSALSVFEAESDAPRTASTLHSLGNVQYMLGEFEGALASYNRTLASHEASSNKYAGSSVLQAIALVHKEVGNYPAAAEAYARSSAWSVEASDTVGAAKAEHGLGDVFRLAGDSGRALEHLSASRALWEKTTDSANRAGTLFLTGQVHALQRNFGAAVEWYQRALDLDQKLGEQAGIARDLGGLGGANFGIGQLALALEQFKKSLGIREQLQDQAGVMWTLAHMGVLFTAMENHAEALAVYQRALGLAETQGDPGAVCTILALRAANELQREDADTALETAAKAVQMAERLDLFDALAYARTVAGKAHRRAGRKDEARKSFEEAIAAVERVPIGPGVETFFDDRRTPYFAMADFLVAENRAIEAFDWWERARTKALAAMLGGDGSVVIKGLSAEERDSERQLAADTRMTGVKLRRERARTKPDAARVESLQKELERLQSARQQFRAGLFGRHPALASLRSQAEPARVESAVVPAGAEALISFAVGEDHTIVFLVTRDATTKQVRVDAQPVDVTARDLAARVRGYREALTRREQSTEMLGRELHTLLLERVRPAAIGARTLVVVPDAFLWSLPFEALRGAAQPYLAHDFALSYVPSLTALVTMRSVPASAGEAPASLTRRPSLVVAADPLIAPRARARLVAMGSSAPTAPATSREVQRLSLVFGSRATQVLVGEQARSDRILAAVKPGSALHLDLPACVLERSPLHSIVTMTASGPNDDDLGLVEMTQAMAWPLNADVVVLPTVEQVPAGGAGDGLIALAWSLFVAGSPTTVVGRWAHREQDGSPAVRAFYRAWLARPTGSSVVPSAATALQKAVRAIIAQPGSQPADWAGLMVIGR